MCETVIGIVLCFSHQAGCLVYSLGEINNRIHDFTLLFSDVVVVSDLNKNSHTPINPPP